MAAGRVRAVQDTRDGYTAYTATGLCTQSGNMRGHHARISCHLMAHEGGWKDDKEETQGERRAHHKSSTGASITQASRKHHGHRDLFERPVALHVLGAIGIRQDGAHALVVVRNDEVHPEVRASHSIAQQLARHRVERGVQVQRDQIEALEQHISNTLATRSVQVQRDQIEALPHIL
jgi:hypothetical protein